MSLDDRLRADLREMAADVDPSVATALRAVFAARDRRRGRVTCCSRARRGRLPGPHGRTADMVVHSARGDDDDVVIEPPAPLGTYETTLSGDLAGLWRLRFGDGQMRLVAPDTEVLGSRTSNAPYDVVGNTLTTELLGERCGGAGSYTWKDDQPLELQVEDDDCDLRVRLLTEQEWSLVAAAFSRRGRTGRRPSPSNACAGPRSRRGSGRRTSTRT